FDREDRHHLAARLHQFAERTEVTGEAPSGLLFEFPDGGRQRILARVVLALGDRPGAEILLGPKGPAGMHEQNLEAARAAPIHEDAGTALWHGPTPERRIRLPLLLALKLRRQFDKLPTETPEAQAMFCHRMALAVMFAFACALAPVGAHAADAALIE